MSAPEKDFLRATISYSPSFQDYCQRYVYEIRGKMIIQICVIVMMLAATASLQRKSTNTPMRATNKNYKIFNVILTHKRGLRRPQDGPGCKMKQRHFL